MRLKNMTQNIFSAQTQIAPKTAAQISVFNTVKTSEVAEWKLLERIMDQVAATDLPYKQVNRNTISENLNFLNRKLDSVRKTITAWDTYKIATIVNEDEDLDWKINTLEPNSSLVFNGIYTQWNGHFIKRGDIIYKDLNNKTELIPGISSGYYFPTAIKPVSSDSLTNTYSITYQFTENSVNPGDVTITTSETGTRPYRTMTFKDITLNNATDIYNWSGTLAAQATCTKELLMTSTSSVIFPEVIWYTYVDSEQKYERIYLEDAIQIKKETKTIKGKSEEMWSMVLTNNTNLTLKFVVR